MKRWLGTTPLLALFFAWGCTAFAGKADYADYRAVRMASDERERLLAMQRYASRHPDGRFFGEIQAEREARELEVFEGGKATRPGLELYLQAYPEGRFAGQARSMLEAMKQVDDRRRRDSERAKRRSLQRQQRRALLSRTWVARFASWWIRALLAIEGWGAPLSEVARGNPGFSSAFGAPPVPQCSREECVKGFRSRFGVPVPGGTRIEREVRVLLRLRVERGELRRAELLLPERGFSRWFELENQQPIIDDDNEDRERAVSWAFDALHRLLTEGEGDVEPREGVVLPLITGPALTSVPDIAKTEGDARGIPDISAGADSEETAVSASSELERAEPANPFAAGAGPATDLVMDPLAVLSETAPPAPSQQPATDLVMEPLSVTEAEAEAPVSGLATAVEEDPRAKANREEGDPYRVRAFGVGKHRVVLFASEAGWPSPAYDGVVIEVAPVENPSR